jgi:RHS repeat-associated protein
VAVAQDNLGRNDTNTVSVNLPTAVTFLYDQNGNLRTNGTRIFEYDDENQLTRITEPNAWKSEFVYDGKMKMRISRDYTWQGGAWLQTNEVRRVYDGMLAIQERNSLNVPTLTYTRGRDLSGSLQGAGGIGGLLALSDQKSTILNHSYYHADGNGNVTCLVDTNQTVVARYLSDPYGNSLSVTGSKSDQNCYRFSSKESHAGSGLVYYGYRWYIPELQRWLNRDPLGSFASERGSRRIFAVEVVEGPNLYGYVRNQPLDNYDPNGLFLCCILTLNCVVGAPATGLLGGCDLGCWVTAATPGPCGNCCPAVGTAYFAWSIFPCTGITFPVTITRII